MLQLHYIADKQNKRLRSLAGFDLQPQDFALTRGDQCVLCLYFKRYDGSGWVLDPVPATSVKVAAIKRGRECFSATFLAFSDASAWNRAGDWSDSAPESAKESVLLDLSDPDLLNEFKNGEVEILDDYLDFVFEVEETDSAGHKSTLVRQVVRIWKDVINGTEDRTTEATPVKPTLEEVLALCVTRNTAGGDFRVKDGKLQKINRTTLLWHDWGFETVAGVVRLWIAEEGEV